MCQTATFVYLYLSLRSNHNHEKENGFHHPNPYLSGFPDHIDVLFFEKISFPSTYLFLHCSEFTVHFCADSIQLRKPHPEFKVLSRAFKKTSNDIIHESEHVDIVP